MKKRYLVIGIIILSYFSLFIGAEDINIMHIFAKNQHKLMIFIMSRIPRLISILIAGVGMSIAGLIMQQISKNKFVSPTTGATIDAAQFGIVICMLLVPTASIFTKTIIAFVFSLVTDFIAYKYDLSQNVSSWMQGDFSMILKGNYEILYITIPLIILAYIYANKFTVVGMGMDFATNLGLSYKRIVNIGLIIVALVTVCVVVTAGNIPFIGLIVPNIVSLYMGDNIRASIWYTGLLGAIFVLICDIFGRIIIYPYEISIGLTVGVIGSILFLYLILRRNVNEA